MNGTLLIYGAYGYTGRLIAERAVQQGHSPVLAGRNGSKLAGLADDLTHHRGDGDAVETRSFSLDGGGPRVADHLGDVDAVLNCAGPFVDTYEPIVEACLRTGTDYLDVTGEMDVFEAIAAQDHRAREAGITLLPGVGFDVVPTDCLAAYLHDQLPDADRLTLAFEGLTSASAGTARTAVENLSGTVAVRENGAFVSVPLGERTRRIDFGSGPRLTTAVPWGDVSTAYHTTGIGSIEVYVPVSRPGLWGLRLLRYAAPVLALSPVRSVLSALVDRFASGPDEETRQRNRARIYGEVRRVGDDIGRDGDDPGQAVAARMVTPDPYAFTVESALECARRVLDGRAAPGFTTPAGEFGPDLALSVDGTERELLGEIE